MISILNQKVAEGRKIHYPLLHIVKAENEPAIEISKNWILIVLKEEIRTELEGDNNNLWGKESVKPRIFSFEELFEKNVNLLNEKVKELTKCEDYYKMWLEKV